MRTILNILYNELIEGAKNTATCIKKLILSTL